MTKRESIEEALQGLRARDINYLDVLACIGNTGSLDLLVRTGPGTYMACIDGQPPTPGPLDGMVTLFRWASERKDKEAAETPGDKALEILPGQNLGTYFTLDPKICEDERVREQKELEEYQGEITRMIGEITKGSEFKITVPSATEPIRSEELASMEDLEEERRRNEEAGIPPIADGQST